MSALGHYRTCAPQNVMSALPPIATAKADMPQMVMSALPPKADMCDALAHVCFGPKADIAILLNQLIGNGEHARRNGQPEPFSGLGIDHQIKPRRLLDR
jgi:hypothetical protein